MPNRLDTFRLAARVLRGEGPRGLRDRIADDVAERLRRLSYWNLAVDLRGAAGAGAALTCELAPPVLYFLASPPKPSLGGLQTVVRRWLTEASRHRTVALLFPERPSRYRLEVTGPGTRRSFTLFTGGDPRGSGLRDGGFERALGWTLERTGARVLHLLGLHGVALESLERLLDSDLALVTSVHDFSAFCFRPHLLEQPMLRFCDYCQDLDRCDRCLRHDLRVGRGDQARRRAVAEAVLTRARAVVFPSRFLRAVYEDLFPALPPEALKVIEPGDRPAPRHAFPAGGRRRAERIAFVGSALPHKGILVFEEVVERLADTGRHFLVLGGGDSAILRRLRSSSGVRVRGYYRQGSLPRILERERVDLALLLSIVPEAYGLTLNECRTVGVPVIAYDQGALGERIRREGGGVVVPPAAGVLGVAAAVDRFDGSDPRLLTSGHPPRTAADEEEDWRQLYDAILAGATPPRRFPG